MGEATITRKGPTLAEQLGYSKDSILLKVVEAILELEAQIMKCLEAGINPTHIDPH